MTPKQLEAESAKLERIADRLGTKSQKWLQTVKEANVLLNEFYRLRIRIKRLKRAVGDNYMLPYKSLREAKFESLYSAEAWLITTSTNLLDGKNVVEKIDILPWQESMGVES